MTPLVSRMLMLTCLCFTLSGVSQAERLVGSGMFCDQPNFRVGQLLTVLIMEMGSGSNTANTNTKRENALDLSASADGGPFTGLPVLSGSSSTSNEHKAKGSNTRSNKLSGTITTEIVAIEEDGTLVLEGTRIVELDGEQQITQLTGRVRPEDVRSDNSVYSYHLADAVISYSGRGVVADAQRRSVFNYLFGWLF